MLLDKKFANSQLQQSSDNFFNITPKKNVRRLEMKRIFSTSKTQHSGYAPE